MIGFVLVGLIIWRFFHPIQVPQSFPFETGRSFRVTRVIDGDTIELTDGTRVRLIGVDTPEYIDGKPQPFAAEATTFTRQFLSAQIVQLHFGRQRLDRYNRVLAFVWVEEAFLNEELIRAGLATAETQYDYRSDMKSRFVKAQRTAQAAKRGIWSAEIRPD
jgi:micrococcal nuclease